MKPDFIIVDKHAEERLFYLVLPTHNAAQSWLFAYVTGEERRSVSAYLSPDRLAQFKSDAAIEKFTFQDSLTSSPQPAGGGK
jgi:hypothetical protein